MWYQWWLYWFSGRACMCCSTLDGWMKMSVICADEHGWIDEWVWCRLLNMDWMMMKTMWVVAQHWLENEDESECVVRVNYHYHVIKTVMWKYELRYLGTVCESASESLLWIAWSHLWAGLETSLEALLELLWILSLVGVYFLVISLRNKSAEIDHLNALVSCEIVQWICMCSYIV